LKKAFVLLGAGIVLAAAVYTKQSPCFSHRVNLILPTAKTSRIAFNRYLQKLGIGSLTNLTGNSITWPLSIA